MKIQNIISLVEKDLKLEFRQKSSFMGLVLYLVCSILVGYMAFNLRRIQMNPATWSALFWIIQLFTAFNAVGKSFFQESGSRQLYYFQLFRPEEFMLSKIISNSLIMLGLGLFGYLLYSLWLDNFIQNDVIFLLTLVSGSLGFAFSLSLISGIAARAGNNPTLMAILSFPIIIPMLLMVIKLTKHALDGLTLSDCYDEFLILFCLKAIVLVLSFILFPYIWRS